MLVCRSSMASRRTRVAVTKRLLMSGMKSQQYLTRASSKETRKKCGRFAFLTGGLPVCIAELLCRWFSKISLRMFSMLVLVLLPKISNFSYSCSFSYSSFSSSFSSSSSSASSSISSHSSSSSSASPSTSPKIASPCIRTISSMMH